MRALFAVLVLAISTPEASRDQSIVPPGVSSISAEPLPEVDRRAAAALEERLDAPLRELSLPPGVSLRGAFEAVAERLSAGVVIDEPSLTDAGISLEDAALPLTLGKTPVSARTILKLLGEPHEVVVLNRAGLLFVTTLGVSDDRFVTRIHDVGDLLEGVPPRPAPARWSGGGIPCGRGVAEERPLLGAEDQLVDLIQMTSDALWSEVDGTEGTLVLYDGLLVVRQTEAAHAEVGALLAALRHARRSPAAP